MEFFEVLNQRKTVRDFESYILDDAVIEKLVKAAFKAPSNDHLRDWHFVAITDKSIVQNLISKIPETFSDQAMEDLIKDWNLSDACQQECYRTAVPKQYQMLANASCILIPLFKQKVDLMKPENLSYLNGFASIWCAIENLFLAATAENLACSLRIPLGDEEAWARSLLKFPDDYLMPCFIGIGKAKKTAAQIKQKDINLEERIHKNTW